MIPGSAAVTPHPRRAGTGAGGPEHGAGVLVAALSAAFGAAIIQGTGLLDAAIRANAVTGSSETVGLLLRITAWIFIGIAIYAGAIVTTNTFSVIVAGRVRGIALRRLLGSTARAERGAVAREGLAVGVVGALIGLVVGSAGVAGIGWIAAQLGMIGPAPYSYANPVALLPAAAVVVTTWVAAVIGSRRVLSVTPMQALGGAEESSEEESRASVLRTAVAGVLVVVGAVMLIGGVALGAVSFFGLVVAFFGGIISFTGIVLGAHLVIPRALRIVGRLMGASATARLAAENAIRYPQRSTRSTIGLLVAVTLITTFAVAARTFGSMIEAAAGNDPAYYAGTESMLGTVTAVFTVLTGFSAVIAGVGLVNSLSLGVLQRTRELGLLRALGFSAKQLRRMILAESGQLVLTAIALGLVLGTVYGWAGAHSLLGAANGMPGVWFIGIPWPLVAVVVAGGVLLSVVAAAAPARRATRVAPVEALGVE